MWLGLAFPGTRLFIQRKKKRAPKQKNNIELSKQIGPCSIAKSQHKYYNHSRLKKSFYEAYEKVGKKRVTYSSLSDKIKLWGELDYILDFLFNAKKGDG